MHFFPDSRKNKKNKKEVVLILDIGSGSVAGSFVEFNIGQDPRVLYVKRVPIKLFLTLSGERFKKAMLESLSITLNDLNKNGLRQLESYSNNRVKKVYCSLASPWFVSQTKTLVVKEDKEFTITAKFISDLLQKEEDSFENSNLSKYSSNKRHASEVIERKLIDVRLNGYKVKDPIGKKAQSAEFDIFLSMSQATILDSIEDVLSKYFLTEEINFHSFTLVSFSAIRDIYESVSSFLFLDITGEVTDISIIKLGTILKTASFPVGKNSVIREVTKTLKTKSTEALSMLRLLFSRSLDSRKVKTLEKIISGPREIWLKEFQRALVGLSSGSAVPTTVFFAADEDFSSWYGEIIRSDGFIQSSTTDNNFIVSFITPSALSSYVSFKSTSEKDAFIAIESIFFNRLFELKG